MSATEVVRRYANTLLAAAAEAGVSDDVLRGDMGTKSRAIYEALLNSYDGDWRKVVRFVRVERFNI